MTEKPSKRFRWKVSRKRVVTGGRFRKPRKKTLVTISYKKEKHEKKKVEE